MAHIISITDFDTPELDVYARLTENQLVNRADPANALFIAESPLVIGRALESGCVPVSFLMEPRHLTSQALPLLERCPEDIPVYTAAPEVDVYKRQRRCGPPAAAPPRWRHPPAPHG